MPKKKKQVGTLPVRRNKRGKVRVLLVTARGRRRRWVIPKGSRSQRLRDKDAAAREAWEEGGVTGRTSRRPVGVFTHRKRNGDVKKIKVFRLDVESQQQDWPERKQRKRVWASLRQARRLIETTALRRIIEQV